MNLDPQKLTKLEATSRQLRQAIHLFLSNGDLIAVHTLAAASLQVLSDLSSKVGIESMLKGGHRLVRTEKRKFVKELFSSAENFFKHADRDPEAILEFFPAATPLYLIDAVTLYEQLTKESMPACRVFYVWFSLNYPDVLVDSDYKKHVEAAITADPTLREAVVAYGLLLAQEKPDA